MFQRAQYILASQSRRQLIMDVERANGPRNVVVRNFAEDEKEHEVAIEQRATAIPALILKARCAATSPRGEPTKSPMLIGESEREDRWMVMPVVQRGGKNYPDWVLLSIARSMSSL